MQNIKTRKILGYDDVAACSPGENHEPLVDIRTYDRGVQTEYFKPDMQPYTGNAMFLRDTVAKKLGRIDSRLARKNLQLKVVYGYRHPKVQEMYFRKRRQELALQFPDLTDDQLNRRTHDFVAVPEVAGHPTGGAVDLTITDMSGRELDMGSHIADYSDHDKIRTFTSKISSEQDANRHFLHDLMTSEGFAPFYGEWWHFSYGDREWGAFYGFEKSMYDSLDYMIAT